MANFELKFNCLNDKNCKIEVKNIDLKVIEINISNDRKYHSVFLDKSSAIKFSKTIRTEINKITESEVNNG